MAETTTTPTARAIAEWADDWRQRGPVWLASAADCAAPDTNESAGASFLYSVRDATLEAVEYLDDPDDLAAIADELDEDGRVHEIADLAPDVYTHTRWTEFVDLSAYNEDATELGATADDLTGAAGVALYMIAERLARAILATLTDYTTDEDADT